jgi:peptidoglycan hydrolase-like protein with peptidoglycan-binding domain
MALVSPRFARDQRLQAAAENRPPLSQGATGKAVEILQRALIDVGYDMPVSTTGSTKLADGIYGIETATSVRSFQIQQGLQQDGVAGRDTLGRLDRLITLAGTAKLARDAINSSRLRCG